MTNLPIGQITQLTESPRPRMMPVHSPILQVRQNLRDAEAENANLRDLLNTSMAENTALLQQVAEMQKALNMQIKTFDAMKLNSDRALENWMNTCAESDKRIDEFTKQLADAQALHGVKQIHCGTVQGDCNKWHDAYVALLEWSQAAYKRLGGLMAIGVSMTPDAVTAKLLVGAPANVSAGMDPFSAEVDSAYSIYADPIFVSVAKELGCEVEDVVDYAQ